MDYVLATLAVVTMLLLAAAGWAMNLLSLPGNWLVVLGVAVYAYLVPNHWRIDISWYVVALVLALAVIGELIESLAGMWGAARAGGSRRAALLALCGSIGGGLVGAVLGMPIPVVGPIVAVLLGASLGATAGAWVGEQWKGRTAGESWQVGKAAFWGRLLGTFGKIMVASVIVAVVLLAIVLR